MLVSAKNGIAAPWAVYGIWADSWGGTAKFKNFYGCSFPISANGVFCTCNHVLPMTISDDEMLVIQHPADSKCHRVAGVKRHKKYDMAVFTVELSGIYCQMDTSGELLLGDDVFAYGYYDWRKDGCSLEIIPQLHKGYITATPRMDVGFCALPSPWYQLSFPVLPGFSGSPLYRQIDNQGIKIVGMVNECINREVAGAVLQQGRAYPSYQLKKHIEEM